MMIEHDLQYWVDRSYAADEEQQPLLVTDAEYAEIRWLVAREDMMRFAQPGPDPIGEVVKGVLGTELIVLRPGYVRFADGGYYDGSYFRLPIGTPQLVLPAPSGGEYRYLVQWLGPCGIIGPYDYAKVWSSQ